MTLNITVISEKSIYQSADFRLVDMRTRVPTDFGGNRKIFLINRFKWHATVCFCGVGHTGAIRITDWVAERISRIGQQDPIERLVDGLLEADSWLAPIRPPHNRHSFSIGAYVGIEPTFILVSNFEAIGEQPRSEAAERLFVTTTRPTNAKTYVSGQTECVERPMRRWLERLLREESKPAVVHSALAATNRRVAERSAFVSSGCLTTYINRIGQGSSMPHGIQLPSNGALQEFPAEMREAMKGVLEKQFGKGRYSVAQVATARAEETEEFHRLQMKEKPGDPSAHCNYGAFLQNQQKPYAGAEAAYRRALKLCPDHTNALGNLALVMEGRGEFDEAERLYRGALSKPPIDENATFNYARFLMRAQRPLEEVRAVLTAGLADHPASHRLVQLEAEVFLRLGRADAATQRFRKAGELGAPQVDVEAGVANALHVGGATPRTAIDAYRTAIALNPKNGVLALNLAQLLFQVDETEEAFRRLRDALAFVLEPSALLEAHFYRLAYSAEDPAQILRSLDQATAAGGRLAWNMVPTIEHVRRSDSARAEGLARVAASLEQGSRVSGIAAVFR